MSREDCGEDSTLYTSCGGDDLHGAHTGKTASNFVSPKTSQTVGGAGGDIEFLFKVIYDYNRGGASAC